MKTKFLFQWIMHALLILISAGNISLISNQTVLAKPNEHVSYDRPADFAQESKPPSLLQYTSGGHILAQAARRAAR